MSWQPIEAVRCKPGWWRCECRHVAPEHVVEDLSGVPVLGRLWCPWCEVIWNESDGTPPARITWLASGSPPPWVMDDHAPWRAA